MTNHPIAVICRTLGVGRATLYRATTGRPAQYAKADDPVVTGAHPRSDPPVWFLRLLGPGRLWSGRVHARRDGQVSSNERWPSDTLAISCWNGELIEVGSILDRHNLEAIAHVAVPRKYRSVDVQHRLTSAARACFDSAHPVKRLQLLSDNGGIYTALDIVCTAEQLGRIPTPSLQSAVELDGRANR